MEGLIDKRMHGRPLQRKDEQDKRMTDLPWCIKKKQLKQEDDIETSEREKNVKKLFRQQSFNFTGIK